MNKEFRFESKGHKYYLGEKRLTGCTTILGVIAKPFLIPWAANMAVDHIEKHQVIGHYNMATKTGSIEFDMGFTELLKEARKAHTRTRDKAGDVGTIVHKHCENFINTKQIQEIKDPKEKKMFDNFYLWQKKNKVKFLASERKTYHEELFFAGTFDFLCEIDGKTWLGDIKTGGNRIYPEAFFQMAGYQICEEERRPDVKIDGHIVLGLFKDGKFSEKRSISNGTNKQAFLSALNLYRTLEQIKKTTL